MVQRGADLLRGQPKRRRFLAVDIDDRLWALDLQIGADVLQNRKRSHLLLDQRSVSIKLVEIAGRQRVLVERPGRTDADVQVLDRLEEHIDAGDGADLPA